MRSCTKIPISICQESSRVQRTACSCRHSWHAALASDPSHADGQRGRGVVLVPTDGRDDVDVVLRARRESHIYRIFYWSDDPAIGCRGGWTGRGDMSATRSNLRVSCMRPERSWSEKNLSSDMSQALLNLV